MNKGYRPPMPPGPRGLPVLGVLPHLLRDPFGYLPRLTEKYGDVVNVPVPGQKVIAISHPDFVSHAWVKHVNRYAHANEVFAEAMLGGPGLLSLPVRDGDDWKRVRKVLNPKFTEKSLAPISAGMVATIQRELDSWDHWADSGTEFEMQEPLAVLAMSVLQHSMFANDPTRPDLVEWARRAKLHGQHISKAWITAEMMRRLPGRRAAHKRLPWPHLQKGQENVIWWHETISAIVAERRANPVEESDLLNLLLETRFEDGSPLSEKDLSGELFALLFAGFETTAAAMAWTLGLLSVNPDELALATAAVDALGDVEIGYEHLPQLTYLRACFDEGQRIQGAPIAPPRWAKEDDVIGGYFIPKGTMVLALMSRLHRDPRFWSDPDKFKPSRFLDEDFNPCTFLAFGTGPRKCLGVRMAYIEGTIALAKILQRYRIETPAGWSPEPDFHFSTGLKSLPMTLYRRSVSR